MAITKTLSQFKSTLAGGGARPNLFEVSIPSFAAAVDDTDWTTDYQNTFKFLCKAAQLPASTVAPINVPFRGRILKVAGDRTFAEWTVTIINDEDFVLRTAFEKWSDKMSNLIDATGVTNPTSYMTNAFVKQLGRGATVASTTNEGGTSAVLRTYKFYDIWPSEVSAIELSYDNTDTVEEFTVTFQVQYFTIGETDDTADGDETQGTDAG
jgi:hypothetical protein|tara:strand:+ start:331 stop:960 length:630 start_codon:yes stop_codon:yes gene_type:complete